MELKMDEAVILQNTVAELVTANHILFDRGIVDGFGHVSVRHPLRADHFLLSRNRAPALVTAEDILTFDLDGNIADRKNEPSYLERFIHGEIYRVRPEVLAVVHSHAVSILPFTVVTSASLCPVCHMSGFIKRGTPVFEIRCHAGEGSDLLIRTPELGRHLASTLGNHVLVLMRGHGMTIVGATLRQAVFRSVYAEVNARIQTTAGTMGDVTFLTAEEADAADATGTTGINRAWEFWALSAEQTATRLRGA
jgi:ribulose-5-phosphate 4-epimerase/fuculose-1-phosphate aldolase